MTDHFCAFCDKESRFVCVKCKRDICKDHAYYERHGEYREWVCTECHSKNVSVNVIFGIIAVIIFIIAIVVFIIMFNKFSDSPFP